MADTQLGMEGTFGDKSKRGDWSTELALMRRAAEEVNRLQPAFAIVCGDLIDEFPSEERDRRGVDPEMRARQERDFMEVCHLVDTKIPLLCLCGNHDIGNRPNAVTVNKFVENFGDDYFTFWCQGVKCLVLNSQLWQDDTDAKELREDMDRWLDQELGDAGEADTPPPPVIIFSHIAPFLFEADEDKGYFNLEPEFRKSLLQRAVRGGAVAWFCGHYHRNTGGFFHHESGRKLEVIVTAAVGTQILDRPGEDLKDLAGMGGHKIGEEASGLRIVDVRADGTLEHRWRTFAELREEAAAPASCAVS